MLDFQFTNGHWNPKRPYLSQEAPSFGWSVWNVLLKFRIAEYSASHCKSSAAVSSPQLRMMANAKSSTFIHRWMTHPEWLFAFYFGQCDFVSAPRERATINQMTDKYLTPQMLPLILSFLQLRLCLQPTKNKHKDQCWIWACLFFFVIADSLLCAFLSLQMKYQILLWNSSGPSSEKISICLGLNWMI